uniref:Protein tweety homolog n=1 Tax=Elaeophora elaphi TaxID=1147741 RepID=A0A0R3S5B5_9BILA
MMVSEVLIKILRTIPRFTFDFQPAPKIFTLHFDSSYVQSLFVFVGVILFIGAALLLTITITWICQCCTGQDANVKSRRRVRQLSLVLFIISVICFFCLGICLFGNEHLNRSIMSSIASAEGISRNLLFADSQSILLNDYCSKTIKQIDTLSGAVESAAEKRTDVNKTTLNEFILVLDSVSQKVDSLGIDLAFLRKVLSGNVFFQRSSLYTQRIELERWVLCATLLSIMLIVLFAGVIAFCRQSRKGAVVFSGLGFAIFIVGWLLLAAIFPASMALVDFCADGTQFIREYMSNETMALFDFYRKCNPTITHDNLPSVIHVDKIGKQLSDIREMSRKFEPKIEALFNNSTQQHQFDEQVKIINDGMIFALKNMGALETTVGCYTYNNDMSTMERSFCTDGIIGSSILLYCLVLLEAFLFALLLIVSKSWHLFARLPSDYIEVDEEDPFFPRGNDSTIPVDIYGTHVLNPRTRFANSLDRTEQSTGTTSATCGLANGSVTNHTSASTALLNSNAETSTPPWHRGLGSQPAASSAANAPPAVGTSRFL